MHPKVPSHRLRRDASRRHRTNLVWMNLKARRLQSATSIDYLIAVGNVLRVAAETRGRTRYKRTSASRPTICENTSSIEVLRGRCKGPSWRRPWPKKRPQPRQEDQTRDMSSTGRQKDTDRQNAKQQRLTMISKTSKSETSEKQYTRLITILLYLS